MLELWFCLIILLLLSELLLLCICDWFNTDDCCYRREGVLLCDICKGTGWDISLYMV